MKAKQFLSEYKDNICLLYVSGIYSKQQREKLNEISVVVPHFTFNYTHASVLKNVGRAFLRFYYVSLEHTCFYTV